MIFPPPKSKFIFLLNSRLDQWNQAEIHVPWRIWITITCIISRLTNVAIAIIRKMVNPDAEIRTRTCMKQLQLIARAAAVARKRIASPRPPALVVMALLVEVLKNPDPVENGATTQVGSEPWEVADPSYTTLSIPS